MNDYSYEELSVGTQAMFSVTITARMMDAFRETTGDENPLHCDEAYAQAAGYPDRIVYGMLTSSFYSTLAGMYLPGKRCVLYSVETTFRKPVFIGDELRVFGRVAEKNDTFRMIVVKAEIVNQRGEKVSKARFEAGVR